MIQSDLERRIARERRRVAELRNELIRREAFIQGLQEAIKMLSAESADVRDDPSESLRAGSDVRKAQELLSEASRPLHISDILKGIGKTDTRENRASLASSLARYARRGELFQREGPNEFSLLSPRTNEPMQPDNTDEEAPDLPPSFGSANV
jgi:hypothetical protein